MVAKNMPYSKGTYLRRWGHINLHGVTPLLCGSTGLGVDEQGKDDRDSLDATVAAAQHKDYVLVLTVELTCCKHDGEHDEEFVDRHLDRVR